MKQEGVEAEEGLSMTIARILRENGIRAMDALNSFPHITSLILLELFDNNLEKALDFAKKLHTATVLCYYHQGEKFGYKQALIISTNGHINIYLPNTM